MICTVLTGKCGLRVKAVRPCLRTKRSSMILFFCLPNLVKPRRKTADLNKREKDLLEDSFKIVKAFKKQLSNRYKLNYVL